MEMATQVQILEKVVYISLCANALTKGMNPSILPSSSKETVEQAELFGIV